MSATRSGGQATGTGGGRPGRPADAPFLAVSIACLLAVVLAASPLWEPAGQLAAEPAEPVPAVAVPNPAPSPDAPAPGPVFAVRRGPLAGLTGSDGRLAWHGVQAGMERSAVAARLGALPPAVPHPVGWCGEHESRVRTPGGEAILAFDGPGEQARLTSTTVVVPAAEGATGPARPAPVFQTASGERIAVEPGVGLTFGDVCLG